MVDFHARLKVENHVKRWKGCRACSLCDTRFQTVFWRGVVPAEVLFIGEAPGPVEDALGSPFKGDSGRVLDKAIDKVREIYPSFTFAVTNAVICYPGRTDKDVIATPKKEHIAACQPRLLEFVEIIQPKIVIRLGNIAKSATKELVGKYIIRSTCHPSWIAHMHDDPSMQNLEFERFCNRLTKWVGEALDGNNESTGSPEQRPTPAPTPRRGRRPKRPAL